MTLNKLTFLRVSSILSSIFKISFLKISFYSTTCTLSLVLLPSDKQKTLDRASLQFLGFGATQQCSLAAVPQRVCSKNHLAAPAVTFRKQVPLALHTVPSPESYSLGCLLPSSQISLFLFISVPLKTATTSIYIYSRASHPSQREDSLLLLVETPGAQPRDSSEGLWAGAAFSHPPLTLPQVTGGNSHHVTSKTLQNLQSPAWIR